LKRWNPVPKEKPLTKVPEEELSDFEKEQLEIYKKLPEDQKAGYKKKIETKKVGCKLRVDQIDQLDELHPDKRCAGVRKAVEEYLYKHGGPEDTDVNQAWEALKAQFPETEGFDYFQGASVIAKAMGIEEDKAYDLFNKLCRDGFSKRIQTGDYVVYSDRIGSELQLQEERQMLSLLEEFRNR
jgi:hypothetical protein